MLRILNFILLITFLFLFRNEKIMSNYYMKLVFYLTIAIAGIYAIKDILLKVKEILKECSKYMFFRIIFYILLTILFMYFLFSNLINMIYHVY